MPRAYLVGGGIASLAAAVFLIRDGRFPGGDICIFEQEDILGGSLDGAGSPEAGYVIRGGRMFNFTFLCTYDLLSSIPSLADPGRSVRQEIVAFNDRVRTRSTCRLVGRGGRKIETSTMGLRNVDRMALLGLLLRPERSLGRRQIDEFFGPGFFRTNFWRMWATMFAFQPWHDAAEFRRYLRRFLHEFPRINTLEGVDRTPYNQFDSIIRPLVGWLRGQGVRFAMRTRVTDLEFGPRPGPIVVELIRCVRDGDAQEIALGRGDLAFVTLGSMTACSRLGSMTSPAPLAPEAETDGAWALWEAIAEDRPEFGRPAVFDRRVSESYWPSFTVTLRDPTFLRLEEELTGNAPGSGGLVSFVDSSWLLSIVVAHQPHFLDQPNGVQVFWGYGLFPDRCGDYVAKPMTACSGAEILAEVCGHLGFAEEQPRILATSTCIPCAMPFITSQFLTRGPGDRPAVIPSGSKNLAFLGQYCEQPDDVVFTVEYSVRSAMTAVYTLLGLEKRSPPIYAGYRESRVLWNAIVAAMR